MSSANAVRRPQAGRGLEIERCAEAVAASERLLHLAKSGVRKLIGAPVMASDLRASAALVLAGLAEALVCDL